MIATIWHNSKCGTSRKTLAILEESDAVSVKIVAYLKEPFERQKLEQLIADAGLTAREALRVRGSRAEELGLTSETDQSRILDAMAKDPALVERPFVETEKGVRLCRPQDKVYDIL